VTVFDPLAIVMTFAGFFLALAAPMIWLGTTFLLTRGGRPGARIGWLLLGLLLLVPWPALFGYGGSAGAL